MKSDAVMKKSDAVVIIHKNKEREIMHMFGKMDKIVCESVRYNVLCLQAAQIERL